jgi:GGDEF domain-containing protein
MDVESMRMIFSPKKAPSNDELTSALFKVVQQLLEGCALHSVEIDAVEHAAFRASIRSIARRFEAQSDYRDLLILAGETNKTVQAYNQQVERLMLELSVEKQQALKLLTGSLLRVCQGSETSTQQLRQIERELTLTAQLSDMKDIKVKLAQCVDALCAETAAQESRYLALKEQIAQSSSILEDRDRVTGLATLKNAEARIKELGSAGSHGHVMLFFLKNVEMINRRFGFEAGDAALRRFSSYLAKSLQPDDQLFRWRGPCFVIVTNRLAPFEAIEAEAKQIALRGPEQDIEGNGKSMLIRLMAATSAFPIPKGNTASGLSAQIDQFSADQFKLSHRGDAVARPA